MLTNRIEKFFYLAILKIFSSKTCAICPNIISIWKTPYLTIHCDYNDEERNRTIYFCCLECASHVSLPQLK